MSQHENSEQSAPESEIQDELILVGLVLEELERATAKFGPIASLHEGYAVTLEELDEAWQAIRTKGTPESEIQDELIQVAAMALRTIHDCIGRRS